MIEFEKNVVKIFMLLLKRLLSDFLALSNFFRDFEHFRVFDTGQDPSGFRNPSDKIQLLPSYFQLFLLRF